MPQCAELQLIARTPGTVPPTPHGKGPPDGGLTSLMPMSDDCKMRETLQKRKANGTSVSGSAAGAQPPAQHPQRCVTQPMGEGLPLLSCAQVAFHLRRGISFCLAESRASRKSTQPKHKDHELRRICQSSQSVTAITQLSP